MSFFAEYYTNRKNKIRIIDKTIIRNKGRFKFFIQARKFNVKMKIEFLSFFGVLFLFAERDGFLIGGINRFR